MNGLLWMALYYAALALLANIMIGETIYRGWIDEIGDKAAAFEEMCETIYDREQV